jgi:hypothetical protein
MSENVELRREIRITDGVQGIKYSREAGNDEGKKKFASELEKKLAQEKKRNKQTENDEIIIHKDDAQDKKSHREDDGRNDNEPPETKPLPRNEQRGGLIDFLA